MIKQLSGNLFIILLLGFLPLCQANSEQSSNSKYECLMEPMTVTQVGSQVQGVISELLVDRGEAVSKGQALAVLKSSVERANLLHAQARSKMESEITARTADLTLARHNRDRMQSLHEQKMVPAQQKDEAEAQWLVASAALKQARESFKLLQYELIRAEELLAQRTIRSPVDGVVVEQQAFAGEFVYENPVMTVAQLDPLRVEVVLPGRLFNQFNEYSSGDEAWVYPELDDSPLLARVDVVDRLLDTRSGTFGVRLILPNPALLIPGGQKCQLVFKSVEAAAQ